MKQGRKVYYFYDDSRIFMTFVTKIHFFFVMMLPTEPLVYAATNVENTKTEMFLNEVISYIIRNRLHVDWIGPSFPSALFDDAPKGSVNIPFGSYIIDLTESEDDLWGKMHSKHRNVVRKAEKEEVKVVKGGVELLDDYMIAEKDTMERSELQRGSKEVYLMLFEEFHENIAVYLAYKHEQIQGGAIIIYTNAMGYYMYGASVNHPQTGAMNLLQWKIILDLKNRGVKRYSFVGCRISEDKDSKYQGIQNFKKRFGGDLFVGRMFKYIINPWKYQLYICLRKIKNRGIFKGDIIDQEMHKWI